MNIPCPKCKAENPSRAKFCGECGTLLWAAEPLDATLPTPPGDVPGGATAGEEDFAPGTLFAGRFQIIESLGGGGMGRVYKALDTKVGEKVALKRILRRMAADAGARARFADEMKLARRIAHPNVCRVFDIGEADGAPFISMEYVAGEELKNILRMTKGFSPGQTASIGKQIAAGLAEAHRLGVVHRDLKPQNIMIDRGGTARIMDFGIARMARGDQGRTDKGVMVGTPDYMSPEQAEGADVDSRADLYSLGVMLFEMATGRLPFEAASLAAMVVKHRTEMPPDPRSINPRIPEDLAALILRLLEKDRARRPQTASEVRDALEAIEHEVPATAPVVSQRETSGSRQITLAIPLKKIAIPAAVVIVAAAGVFLVTRFLGDRGASAAKKIPNSIAVVGFENQTGDPKYDHLRKAIPELIVTNLENMGRFQVTTWERIRDLLRQSGRGDVEVIDPEAGFDICRKEGVAAIVTGSFTKAGDTFATNVKLLDADTRRLLKSASARGEGENSILRTQIDELSTAIVGGLAPAGAAAPEKPAVPVMEATTSSMEAYASFMKGRDAMYSYRMALAKDALERAITLDPGFAMAHVYMARVYGTMGDPRRSSEQYRLALSNAGRASDKERLFIEALAAGYVQNDRGEQIRLLRELVKAYPKEKTGWTELGRALQLDGQLEESAAALEKALELDPAFGEALNLLAYNNADLGRYDEAAALFRRYAALFPNDANPVDSMAELDFVRGRISDAEAGFLRAAKIDPEFGEELRVAWMQALREDYGAALETLQIRIGRTSDDIEKSGYRLLRSIFLHLQGREKESREALREGRTGFAAVKFTEPADLVEGWLEFEAGRWDRSLTAFRRMTPLFEGSTTMTLTIDPAVQQGFVLAAEGKLTEAKARWIQADEVLRSGKIPRYGILQVASNLLHARILAGEGDLERARALLAGERPIPQLFQGFSSLVANSFPLERDDLARIYVQLGKRDEAIAEYKILTVIGPGHRNRDPIHPIYHYRLAKLCEEAGNPAEAKAEYARFLKILDKADAESKEMADARKRLAALR